MKVEFSGLYSHLLDVSFKLVIHEPIGTTQQLTLVKLSLITFQFFTHMYTTLVNYIII
jgi:hypothetical protein